MRIFDLLLEHAEIIKSQASDITKERGRHLWKHGMVDYDQRLMQLHAIIKLKSEIKETLEAEGIEPLDHLNATEKHKNKVYQDIVNYLSSPNGSVRDKCSLLSDLVRYIALSLVEKDVIDNLLQENSEMILNYSKQW